MRWRLVLILLAVLTSPAAAEVLLEFHDWQPAYAGRTLHASVSSGAASFDHQWSYGESMPPAGTSFQADVATVNYFDICLRTSSCPVHFETGGSGGNRNLSAQELWTMSAQYPLVLTRSVPGMDGYQLTGITKVIEEAALEWTGGYYGDYVGHLSQTIRFEGVAVPEPRSAVMVGAAVSALPLARRRRSARS